MVSLASHVKDDQRSRDSLTRAKAWPAAIRRFNKAKARRDIARVADALEAILRIAHGGAKR